MNDEPARTPALSEEGQKRLLDNAFALWIHPEIERRIAAGTALEDTSLYAAQIIFDLDASAPKVRLNKEVRAIFDVRVEGTLEAREDLRLDQIEAVESVSLTDANPNAAHVTLLRQTGGWCLAFDFRYNANRVLEALETAREFLDCARFALDRQLLRAFTDVLFSTVELAAKACLLMLPDRTILEGRSHRLIQTRFNRYGGLSGIDPSHVALLNDLAKFRFPARYPPSAFQLTPTTAAGWLKIGEGLLASVSAVAPPRRMAFPQD